MRHRHGGTVRAHGKRLIVVTACAHSVHFRLQFIISKFGTVKIVYILINIGVGFFLPSCLGLLLIHLVVFVLLAHHAYFYHRLNIKPRTRQAVNAVDSHFYPSLGFTRFYLGTRLSIPWLSLCFLSFLQAEVLL